MSAAKTFQFTGWHFLACLVVFFGIDLAVNVGFIVQSVQTFPGEVADDAYEAGVAYDATLAREAIERKLGWLGHQPPRARRRRGVVPRVGSRMRGVVLDIQHIW